MQVPVSALFAFYDAQSVTVAFSQGLHRAAGQKVALLIILKNTSPMSRRSRGSTSYLVHLIYLIAKETRKKSGCHRGWACGLCGLWRISVCMCACTVRGGRLMAKLARSPRRGRRELQLYALHVKKPSHRAPGGSGCVLSMLIHLQRRPLPPQHRLHVTAA